jgi:hypothetical protein
VLLKKRKGSKKTGNGTPITAQKRNGSHKKEILVN